MVRMRRSKLPCAPHVQMATKLLNVATQHSPHRTPHLTTTYISGWEVLTPMLTTARLSAEPAPRLLSPLQWEALLPSQSWTCPSTTRPFSCKALALDCLHASGGSGIAACHLVMDSQGETVPHGILGST